MYLGEEIVELGQDGLDIASKGNLGADGIVQLFRRDLHLIKKSVSHGKIRGVRIRAGHRT